MKTHYFFLCFCITQLFRAQSFSLPWKLESQVPVTDVYSINRVNNDLHVSTSNKSHSNLNNTGWSSSSAIGGLSFGFNDIVFYNGKLYAAAFIDGVFTSTDMGLTWTSFNTGLGGVSSVEFTVWNNVLYVASESNGVYKLDAAGAQWQQFNNGLAAGGWGIAFHCLTGSGNGIIGSVSGNGYVVYHEDTSNTWKGAALKGVLSVGLQTSDLVNTGSQLWAFTNNKAFASADKGLTWTPAGTGMKNGSDCKGFQAGNTLYVISNESGSCVIYKRSLLQPVSDAWTVLDVLKDMEGYGLSHIYNRLYVATTKGLYYLDTETTTGLEEAGNTGLFEIAPNPASGRLSITVQPSMLPAAFFLYDSQGRKILTAPLQSSKEILELSALPGGVYFAGLSADGMLQRKKLVIVK